MQNKKWKFRSDMLNHYINGVSSRTFQDAEDRLNYLESKEQLPDMREKVKEYISELDESIDRYNKETKEIIIDNVYYRIRIQTLIDVKNDLESMLDELVLAE